MTDEEKMKIEKRKWRIYGNAGDLPREDDTAKQVIPYRADNAANTSLCVSRAVMWPAHKWVRGRIPTT